MATKKPAPPVRKVKPAKAAKKVVKARPKVAKKAAKKVAKAPAKKVAGPPKKAAPKKAAKPKVVKPAVAGRAYALAQPAVHHEATKQELEAQHAHEDPRAYGGAIHGSERDPKAQNFGQFKNRKVGRLDKPTNWFRKGSGR